MDQVRSGANGHERQGGLARSHTNLDECEKTIVDEWETTDYDSLAPFGCEEVKIKHAEIEDKSAGKLVVPSFPDETMSEEQGSSASGITRERDDKEKEDRQPEKAMEQDPDQAGKDVDKASTSGVSSRLDFNFLDRYDAEAETLKRTTEASSAFINPSCNLPEGSSPEKFRTIELRLLIESLRRRKIDGAARAPFLGTLQEGEREVHHRNHENRTGCNMDKIAFMEEAWTVEQCLKTQSLLKTGLNRPLMREILDKLDECEGRMSELLIDLATDESEVNSRIKATHQESSEGVVYLSGTRKGTMRSKMVIDKIHDTKMKLGSKVTLTITGKTKVDSEISAKAVNAAKRKRVKDVIDMGQGDDRLPGTSKTMTDVMMVPPIIIAGMRSANYKTQRSDRTLPVAILEMDILSQYGESTLRDLRPSCMNHGKRIVIGQLTPWE